FAFMQQLDGSSVLFLFITDPTQNAGELCVVCQIFTRFRGQLGSFTESTGIFGVDSRQVFLRDGEVREPLQDIAVNSSSSLDIAAALLNRSLSYQRGHELRVLG